jgi:alpha-L-fucosidase
MKYAQTNRILKTTFLLHLESSGKRMIARTIVIFLLTCLCIPSVLLAQAEEPVRIGILTDCQYCNCEITGIRHYPQSTAKLDSCIGVFNSLPLDAVFHLGDMIDHDATSYDSILPRFAKFRAPFNMVLGNHDYMISKSLKAGLTERLGMKYAFYTTDIGTWRFIVLNGDDLSYSGPQSKEQRTERNEMVSSLLQQFRSNGMPWNGGIGSRQFSWLEEQLKVASENQLKVVVMCHFPVLPKKGHNLFNDAEMVELLSRYPCVKAYFNGHYHPGAYAAQNDIHFVNFKGMVDTQINAFADVTLTSDSIIIHGYGREPSRRLGIKHCTPTDRQSYRGNPFVRIENADTEADVMAKASLVTPSKRQMEWQETEFNAFIHFGLNTFYDREWGEGDYDPSMFNPRKLDARQWVRVIRDAGMKMVILTAKHHDGFCLWPSGQTLHTVASSPWKRGKGDVVREVADACREYGLKFGFYLSPWDRHEPSYGNSQAYNDFFCNQLKELLTGYGPVAEVWFDGACGEGPNGRRQEYDWTRYYKLIRQLQPDAVIAIMGPDVRWVGTESGNGRDTEWSVLPGEASDPLAIADASQQASSDSGFQPKDLTEGDLGSRTKLAGARSLIWYPAETDVSIRPGWFYHKNQDQRVKTPEKLVDIYFSSVGKNGVLLLNIPPDKSGLISENDISSLKGMRKILDETFRKNLFEDTVRNPVTFNVAMLQENIAKGQRVEKFHIEYRDSAGWHNLASGTTIGYKRLIRFPEMTAKSVRLVIDESRGEPEISEFGIYYGPAFFTPKRVICYPVTLGTAYSEKYTGGGPDAVVDSVRGTYEFNEGRWQGYEGVDFTATIDLGQVQPVGSVAAGFLQDQESWIFMPSSVVIELSDDGKKFSPAATIMNDIPENTEYPVKKDFSASFNGKTARYVRVRAINHGPCPSWHWGKGGKTWIFVDEIMINP